MIERSDLRAAVAAGVLNEEQATQLIALSDARRGAREAIGPGDEPFELFKGFNEIFIVVGLIILSLGYALLTGMQLVGFDSAFDDLWISSLIAVVGIWALSEYFIRLRRMVAPAIVLSILFAMAALPGLLSWLSQPFMMMQGELSSAVLPLGLVTLALFAHWLRFRVPFALALVALGLFATAFFLAAAASDTRVQNISDLFLLSASGPYGLITLGLGLAVFLAAMSFDMSDPHRVTRRAANGFWLHVIAAPAIVNTIALSLLSSDNSNGTLVLIGFLLFMALTAIIIDRRSFLITGLGYIVSLMFYLDDIASAATLILSLGLGLLALGAFWEKLRGHLLRIVPLGSLRTKLPPSFA